MDNSNSCSAGKQLAVKKLSSLPDCPTYRYSFVDKYEMNKLPYPEIIMNDYFHKKTMTDVAKEIRRAENFNQRMKKKREKMMEKKTEQD